MFCILRILIRSRTLFSSTFLHHDASFVPLVRGDLFPSIPSFHATFLPTTLSPLFQTRCTRPIEDVDPLLRCDPVVHVWDGLESVAWFHPPLPPGCTAPSKVSLLPTWARRESSPLDPAIAIPPSVRKGPSRETHRKHDDSKDGLFGWGETVCRPFIAADGACRSTVRWKPRRLGRDPRDPGDPLGSGTIVFLRDDASSAQRWRIQWRWKHPWGWSHRRGKGDACFFDWDGNREDNNGSFMDRERCESLQPHRDRTQRRSNRTR